MDAKVLEQELKNFDFSSCHSVRENLMNELLTMHRRDNAKKSRWSGRMSDEELDMAAAAGNPFLQGQEDTQRSK